MKKIALICLCTMTALSLLTGCSGSTEGGKENLGTVELGEYKGVKVNMPEVLVTDAGRSTSSSLGFWLNT